MVVMATDAHNGDGEDVTLIDYTRSDLDFEELSGDSVDLKIESPDGHAWYGVEMNGPCRPSFDAGDTLLYVDSPNRVTVAIDEYLGDGEYAEHSVSFRITDHETPAERAVTDGGVPGGDEIYETIGVMRGENLSLTVDADVVPEDNSFGTIAAGGVSSIENADELTVMLVAGRTRLRVSGEDVMFDGFRYFPTDYESKPRGPGEAKVDLSPEGASDYWPERVDDRHPARNMTVQKLYDGLESGSITVLPKQGESA